MRGVWPGFSAPGRTPITCPANQVVPRSGPMLGCGRSTPTATDCSTPTCCRHGATFQSVTTVNCTATDLVAARQLLLHRHGQRHRRTATCPAPLVVSTAPGACNALVTLHRHSRDSCPGAGIVGRCHQLEFPRKLRRHHQRQHGQLFFHRHGQRHRSAHCSSPSLSTAPGLQHS